MATKWKITLGFSFMILTIIGVAWLGYHGLERSEEQFGEYSLLADFNIDAGNAEVELNKALVSIYEYMTNGDAAAMQTAAKLTDALEKRLEAGSRHADKDETIRMYARLSANINAFRGYQREVLTNREALYAEYTATAAKHIETMIGLLNEFVEGSAAAQNVEALRLSSDVWNTFAPLLDRMGNYVHSRKAEEEQPITALLAEFAKELEGMRGVSYSAQGRELHAGMSAAFKDVQASFNAVCGYAAKLRAAVDGLHGSEVEISKDLAVISGMADTMMHDVGQFVAKDGREAKRFMLLGSAGGVIGGGVIAAFITLGIIRVLTELAAYAGAIARGDFSRDIRSREKGEIGTMVSAMRHIPEELGNIIGTGGTLASNIRLGRLRERLNVKDFPGAFGELALAVNTVGDAYTQVIDDIPVPVMAADKSCNILFFNRKAQDIVGSNPVGKPCSETLNAETCGTPNCFGIRAMNSGSNYEGEAVLRIGGKDFIVSVMAVPLKDAQNKPAGFIEILSDLTAIREQERLIMQVADEAAEITARVAAASEELAAQVEQVSRGAEMQRDRVDSTAGAMTEMNATVLEVARSAGEASEQSESTREKAQEGAELVNRVMTSINAVNQVGQNLQGNMQELGKQAESIGSVMNVISDIADQTNLLALNAAIEAARAGEAGRGFAVVADEVRKLAEKTMEATQEVGSSIRAVQQSARVNIDEVGKAVESVVEANALAESSGSALSEIVRLASANSAVVASIATAAEEQSATSEEINRAIDEINQVVGETSDGMVQSTAAVQDLSRTAQELRRVMDRLKR